MKKNHMTQARLPGQDATTPYLELAGEAVLAGMTREEVIVQLIDRIRRDEGYLAYRRASGRRTRYDVQAASDMRASALAVVLLSEGDAFPRASSAFTSLAATERSGQGIEHDYQVEHAHRTLLDNDQHQVRGGGGEHREHR